jgi:outer membrane lipoprotein-sorting protein
MSKQSLCSSFVLAAALAASPLTASAQQPPPPAAPTAPAGETAESLLQKADQQNSSFQDAFFHFKMRIKESSGVREIEFETKQKGNQKRLVRFLSPADIKGMGFLSESADVMYALLPAFGNRVRRLGSHQMNQNFMGSDLTSSDMSVIDLGSMYTPKLVGIEGPLTVLDLTLKQGKVSEYPRLKVWIDSKTAAITKIEYMDSTGKKLRTAERLDLTQDGPNHWSPGRMIYTDHRRGNHQTELILVKSKLNNGYSDDEFTQRALTRD